MSSILAASSGIVGGGNNRGGASAPCIAKPSPFATQPRLSTLLGGTLESTLHELLYVRRIYPRDSFATNRFLGVSCHANRHPAVVDYIYNFLEVAVPALCCGTADELALVVLDSPPGKAETILERFVFSFDTADMNGKIRAAMEARGDPDTRISGLVRFLEPRLRDLLLQVVSMNGMDIRRPSMSGGGGRARAAAELDAGANLTFKLALRIASGKKERDDGAEHGGREEEMEMPSPCSELNEAMKDAKWFQSEPSTCGFGGGPRKGRVPTEVTRNLKSIRAPSCGLNISLNMEIDPN